MRIVAITSDLMDRSRISGALGRRGVRARRRRVRAGADVVVIDLARDAAHVAAVRAAAPDARIVAFGPHVDTEAARRRPAATAPTRAPPLPVLPGSGRRRSRC